MQFRKWPHYLRERKPRHLRVNGSSGPKTPLGCMALMQTTSPQGERGALGLDSLLGRITHAAIQTETHLPYLHPNHDQWIRPRSKEGQPPRWNPSLTHPYLEVETHASPREKVQSGSPLLIRALVDKKEKDFSPQRKEISTNVLTYTTTEPTHKI